MHINNNISSEMNIYSTFPDCYQVNIRESYTRCCVYKKIYYKAFTNTSYLRDSPMGF